MRKFIGILAVSVVLVALVIGCAPGPTPPGPTPPGPTPPGPTPPTITKVKFGCFEELTGPYTEVGAPMWNAENAYYHMWNEEVGKHIGVEIEPLLVDCRADPTIVSEAWMSFRDAGVICTHGRSSPTVNALAKEVVDAEIPMVCTSGSWYAFLPASGWQFTIFSCDNDDRNFLMWLDSPEGKEHEKDKAWVKEGRKPCIGFIGWDNPYGRGPIGICYEYCKEHNMPWAGAEIVPYVFPTAEPQLKRLVANGADYLIGSFCGSAIGIVARDMYRLKLFDRGIEFVLHDGAGCPEQFALGEEAAEGVYATTPFMTQEESKTSAGWEKFARAHKALTGKEQLWAGVQCATSTWTMTAIQCETLRILVEDKGMDPAKITGRDMRDALYEAKFDSEGLYTPTIGLREGESAHFQLYSRIAIWHWYPGKVGVDGDYEIISDWIEAPPGVWTSSEARRAELLALEKEALKGPWTP